MRALFESIQRPITLGIGQSRMKNSLQKINWQTLADYMHALPSDETENFVSSCVSSDQKSHTCHEACLNEKPPLLLPVKLF